MPDSRRRVTATSTHIRLIRAIGGYPIFLPLLAASNQSANNTGKPSAPHDRDNRQTPNVRRSDPRASDRGKLNSEPCTVSKATLHRCRSMPRSVSPRTCSCRRGAWHPPSRREPTVNVIYCPVIHERHPKFQTDRMEVLDRHSVQSHRSTTSISHAKIRGLSNRDCCSVYGSID